MASEWKTYTVQELIDLGMLEAPMDGNHGGIHPKSSDYVDAGVPFIMANDLVQGQVDYNNCAFITEKQANTLKKGFAKPGDVLLTHKATIGRTALVSDEYETIILTPQVTYYRIRNGISNRYLKYYFDSAPFQQLFTNWAGSGSTRAYLGITAQRKLPIVLPPFDIQKKIADCCGVIDDKIIINNRINDNLQQQIKVLVTAWLVDYAPFGGAMPSDWCNISLSAIADFVSGYSYKGAELQPSTTAMATIKNFDRNGGFKLDGFKELIPSSKIKPCHYAEKFDIVVAHTDLTQKAEVIGNAEPIINLAGYDSIVFSMDLVKVVPKDTRVSKFMLAALLQHPRFKAHCLGYVNGTTVLHLSKKALPDYELDFPTDPAVLAPLDDALRVLYMQMATIVDENRKLQDLRDTLLPQLMSGKIDVTDIDA